MTELEQKAEEYLKELGKKKIPFSITNAHNCIKQAYKDGYEQGRIDFSHCVFFEQVCKESDKLAKENEELKAEIKNKEKIVKYKDEDILELKDYFKAQIEKMKCCGNCKYMCFECNKRKDKICEEWELAE